MEVQGFSRMNNSLLASRMIKKRDGRIVLFEEDKILATLQQVCGDLKDIDLELLAKEVKRNIFDGISTQDLEKAYILAACVFIERDPQYNIAASRFLLRKLKREVLGKQTNPNDVEILYRQAFVDNIKKGVELGYLDARMLEFDLDLLASSIVLDRDDLLAYTGLHTLYERYLLRHENLRLELPQTFWMRIAMGLSLQESRKNECALEFYELMSSLYYTPSTPTLFHSGFPRAQLSSCYLNTVLDDLGNIFKCLGDNAQLSKWAGGIGTDWTPIRGTGSFIKGIKAFSQGVVPYLKIANDVVVAITKSGIRRGGTCVYLECWHFDVEDFLDLRRNTGDERRRTHDMNTALWIPDLFMKRVEADGQWTLFSPDEAPELHELYGAAFEQKYEEYEMMALEGRLKLTRTISAKQLWRKMLTRLFETGHPWITFKDACNIRSPQDHAGVIHSSNLCTEITLNTSKDETAVCNLGSINLERHVDNGSLNEERLERTVNGAVRMLDNVVDLNFYPIQEAQNSNIRHRPIGLGLMGFQDALYKLEIPFSSPLAKEFADTSMEKISYFAIRASSRLAQERGAYSSFKGSKWDRGIFPIDTLDILENERGLPIKVARTKRLDWDSLKQEVKHHGMRNSNVMAIAPTATISTIAGCYPSIEPIFKNIYVKSNVSGEFTVVNNYLIEDLKKINQWNTQTLDLLKYYDGDISRISYVPDHLKEKYKTAFELNPEWLADITSVRGKWIDQSQSHNVFMQGASGAKLDSLYRAGWHMGMKTFYYLRTIGATGIEKSTLDTSYGFTQNRQYEETVVAAQSCKIEDPTCESCQ